MTFSSKKLPLLIPRERRKFDKIPEKRADPIFAEALD